MPNLITPEDYGGVSGIDELFTYADELHHHIDRTRCLPPSNISTIGIFRQPSVRTAHGFDAAAKAMGLNHSSIIEGLKPSDAEVGFPTTEPLNEYYATLGGVTIAAMLVRDSTPGVFDKVILPNVDKEITIINCGSAKRHPTQSLVDTYPIWQARERTLDELKIAVAGNVSGSRAARSLLQLLGMYQGVDVGIIAPSQTHFSEGDVETFGNLSLTPTSWSELGPDIDAVYMAGFPESEMFTPEETAEYAATPERLSGLPDTAYLMSPGPVFDEIRDDLDPVEPGGTPLRTRIKERFAGRYWLDPFQYESTYIRAAILGRYILSYSSDCPQG